MHTRHYVVPVRELYLTKQKVVVPLSPAQAIMPVDEDSSFACREPPKAPRPLTRQTATRSWWASAPRRSPWSCAAARTAA